MECADPRTTVHLEFELLQNMLFLRMVHIQTHRNSILSSTHNPRMGVGVDLASLLQGRLAHWSCPLKHAVNFHLRDRLGLTLDSTSVLQLDFLLPKDSNHADSLHE